MAAPRSGQAFVMRENAVWLRYALWGIAIGLGFLVVSAINSPVRDVGKIIGGTVGVLLFGFSGFVLQVRRIVIDPVRREVIITSKEFRKTTTERLRFDEIGKISVLMTFDGIENSRGVNVLRERWSLAFVLNERSVTVTRNLYLTQQHALRDAQKMQQLLGVEIADNVRESIAHLVRVGRKVEAVTLASRALGMTTTQARDFIEENLGPTSS